jgi:hypothetical protein
MLGQMLVLMQMTFLNNVRKVGRLVLSRNCWLLYSKTATAYSIDWLAQRMQSTRSPYGEKYVLGFMVFLVDVYLFCWLHWSLCYNTAAVSRVCQFYIHTFNIFITHI